MAINERSARLFTGTSGDLRDANRTLGPGEVGLETDTGRMKVGDGKTDWAVLGYLGGGGKHIPIAVQEADLVYFNRTDWVDTDLYADLDAGRRYLVELHYGTENNGTPEWGNVFYGRFSGPAFTAGAGRNYMSGGYSGPVNELWKEPPAQPVDILLATGDGEMLGFASYTLAPAESGRLRLQIRAMSADPGGTGCRFLKGNTMRVSEVW